MKNIGAWMLLAVALSLFSTASLSATTIVYDAGPALVAYEAANPLSTGTLVAINGVWSYGTSASVSGGDRTPNSAGFTLFPAAESSQNLGLGTPTGTLQGWNDPAGDAVPLVGVNVTGGNITGCCGTFASNQFWTHPDPIGSGREDVYVRWTAPAAGTVDVSGTWAERGGVASEAYILVNGVLQTSGAAGGGAGTAYGFTSFAVSLGDTIDFATGPNPSVGYGGNSTAFSGTVTLTTVPEPSSQLLIGLGLIGLVAVGKRRRAA